MSSKAKVKRTSSGSEMAAKSLKILVAGDVDGNFKQLFDRVSAVNKKAGPFSMLFCVGSFFPSTFQEHLEIPPAPVPTYILGPVSTQQLTYYPDLNGAEIAPNITYLGKTKSVVISPTHFVFSLCCTVNFCAS